MTACCCFHAFPPCGSLPASFLRGIVSLLCTLLWAATAAADGRLPLLIEIEASSFVSRSCGPIPLTLRVQWAGNGVLEGKLVLELIEQGRDRLGTLVLDDFFVAPGEQRTSLLVPSLPTTWSEQVDVQTTLVTKERAWDLGRMVLRVPGSSKRTMVVRLGVPESELRGRSTQDLSSWLSLEKLQPDISQYPKGNRRPITTMYNEMSAEAFPQDPHWHCAHDVVLLTPEGFGKLEPPQLEALLAWVRAGGSLCILIGNGRFSAAQLGSLNQLAGVSEGDDPRFLASRTGEIVWEALQDDFDGPEQFHFGLGRAVLARWDEGHAPSADDPSWREAAMFLWKFRTEQVAAVRESGRWSLEPGKRLALAGLDYYYQQASGGDDMSAAQAAMAADFQPRPIGGGTGLVEKLLPQGLKLIPLWLIALVLVSYVIAVGPGDYLLLGALRMRKFTWVLFPVTTLGFLAFTIVLSNSFLKSGDHRGSVVFLDIVDGGLVARENELQLLFSGAARTAITEAPRCLFSPMRFQEFGTGNAWQLQRIRERHEPLPTLLQGRMPTQVQAIQALTQWSPQLNRLTRIHRKARADDSGFNWDAPIDPLSETGRAELTRRVVAAFGNDVVAHTYLSRSRAPEVPQTRPDGRVYVSGNQVYNVNSVADSPLSSYARIKLVGGDRIFDSSYDQQYIAVTLPGGGARNQLVMNDFAQQCSVREQTGLFSLVSQVSPMGGHRFEDMALLDPTDPHAMLLVIAQRDGEKWTIYRRLYRANGVEQ